MVGSTLVKSLSKFGDIKESSNTALFELSTNTDWTLIGAPSSNSISRQLMGLDENLNKTNNIKNLRYEYNYSDKKVNLRRYRAGGKLQETSIQASIIDRKTGNIFKPDEGGWLDRDYLLITRFIDYSRGQPRFRTIIGGTHGIGTRGLSLLLREIPLSKNDLKKMTDPNFTTLQILASVDANHKREESIPTHIRVIDVYAV